MPCSDGFADEYEEREDCKHMRAGAELLCSMLRAAEKDGLLFLFSQPVLMWWYEHKKRDMRTGR